MIRINQLKLQIPHTEEALEKKIQKTLHLKKGDSFTYRIHRQAQICCGGVDTTQINPETMESRLVPGLYFAGELIDVDAICGGYNLTWAWASGYVAGQSAASA